MFAVSFWPKPALWPFRWSFWCRASLADRLGVDLGHNHLSSPPQFARRENFLCPLVAGARSYRLRPQRQPLAGIYPAAAPPASTRRSPPLRVTFRPSRTRPPQSIPAFFRICHCKRTQGATGKIFITWNLQVRYRSGRRCRWPRPLQRRSICTIRVLTLRLLRRSKVPCPECSSS